MVKNRMTACCVLLESYVGCLVGILQHRELPENPLSAKVGVIEDDHTGEELEEEARAGPGHDQSFCHPRVVISLCAFVLSLWRLGATVSWSWGVTF